MFQRSAPNMDSDQAQADCSSQSHSSVDLPFTEVNGQRRYGPPSDWQGPPPGRGCEVFVGHIPRHLASDALLLQMFGRVGQVYEMRVMVDYAGHNRGYCFVVYASKAQAQAAVAELHETELLPGQRLGVMPSVDNRRLFIGGIPRSRSAQQLREQLVRLVAGICDVIQYASATDKSKNRGFAFVEFTSHKAAALARQKLLRDKVELWGAPLCVDWAEPEQDVDEHIMQQVRILYLRNLLLGTTEEQLRHVFSRLAPHPGAVERVKKIKDFAFVHFRQRAEAEAVLHKINEEGGLQLEGVPIEVVWAKPPDRSIMRHVRSCMKNMQPSGLLQMAPAAGNAYYKAIVDDASRSLLLSQQLNHAVHNMPHNNILYTMEPVSGGWVQSTDNVPAHMRPYCGLPLYQAPAGLANNMNGYALAPVQMPMLYQTLPGPNELNAQPLQVAPYFTSINLSYLIWQAPAAARVQYVNVMPTAAAAAVAQSSSSQQPPPPDLISTHVPQPQQHACNREPQALGNVAFAVAQLDNGMLQWA